MVLNTIGSVLCIYHGFHFFVEGKSMENHSLILRFCILLSIEMNGCPCSWFFDGVEFIY